MGRGSRKSSRIFSRTRQENIILPFWMLRAAVLTDPLSLALRLIERSNSPIYFANTWSSRYNEGAPTCLCKLFRLFKHFCIIMNYCLSSAATFRHAGGKLSRMSFHREDISEKQLFRVHDRFYISSEALRSSRYNHNAPFV